jgi:hypothetical protein
MGWLSLDYVDREWKCFCFVLALVQYVAPFCLQWPLAQLSSTAWAGGSGLCSVYVLFLLWYSMWHHFACSGHWHNYPLQPGLEVQASTVSIFL